jgi:hypothetical protein
MPKKTIWTLVFFIFFSIATASAVPMNDTIINLTSSHSTVTITYPWTFDRITVGSSWFYVENLSSSNPLQTGTTEKLTFNFTEANKNYAGTDMPYITLSSDIEKDIKSVFAVPITITGYFDVNTCDTTFAYYSNTEVYTVIPTISCVNKKAKIIFTASPGITRIVLLNNYIDSTNDGINGVKTTVYVVFGLIGIMILAAISMLLINMMNSQASMAEILAMIILAIGAAIVLIIGYVIISNVANAMV